jgi:ubiquinone/menaquinone biosynthesis C-methylase UbiE
MSILDLGSGTGVASAAWALEFGPEKQLVAVDRNSWAIQECRWTYKHFGLRGSAKTAEIANLRIPAATAVVAAFTINELDTSSRDRFRREFMKIARNGAPILIVEPIARRMNAWWDEWSKDWKSLGARDDEWRFQIELPDRLALMDKAAGLDHRELTGRSLWLPGLA